MQRTITITLTEPQFQGLVAAVARGQYDIECEMDDACDGGAMKREWQAGERAWAKILRAWHPGL